MVFWELARDQVVMGSVLTGVAWGARRLRLSEGRVWAGCRARSWGGAGVVRMRGGRGSQPE